MKTLEEYMKLPYRIEIIPDADEGGFSVSYPELPGCLTCAETMEKALSNARDAKREWLTSAIEDNIEIPEPAGTDNQQFRLDMPRSLHRKLSESARREGVSIDRYCLYLLTKNDSASADQ